MTSAAVSSLRAHLLSSLTSLPGSRTFRLHVLVSSPRKPTQSLFPYASPRPKCLFQDVLVLLSEQAFSPEMEHASSSTAKEDPTTANPQPCTFVTAIKACVFSFPNSDSTILYISKVDGTGQGIFPSPTSTLLRAFVLFYASPRSPAYMTPTTHHLWIHLFARSQRQYLFPNSADHPNKKPLGDVALCKWWKNNLSDIAKAVEDANDVGTDGVSAAVQSSRLYYLLPGQSEQDASFLLRETHPSPVRWIYSHPYDIDSEALPYPSDPDNSFSSKRYGLRPLASLIPYFEDDPKSRFLDELAATSEEYSVAIPIPTPKKKRQKIEGDESGNSTLTDNQHIIDTIERRIERRIEGLGEPYAPLDPPPQIVHIPPSSSPAREHSPPSLPSTPRPMESSRPNLLSPHTPDHPTFPVSFLPQTPPCRAATTPQRRTTIASPRTPQAPRTPRRPISDLDTTSITEFWERMSYRQECVLGAVTGFFVAVFSQGCCKGSANGVAPMLSNSKTRSGSLDPFVPGGIDPLLLLEGTVPHSVIKRVMSSLLTGVEFSTAERSHKGTQVIETAIKGLCEGLGLIGGGPPTKQPHIDEVNIQAKDTGTTNPHIYQAHVYSSISVSNPPLARESANNPGAAASSTNPPVNVLGVRRKKKRE